MKTRFYLGQILATSLLMLGASSFAQQQVIDPENSEEFYTIQENTQSSTQTQMFAIEGLTWESVAKQIEQASLSLLSWTLHHEKPAQPEQKYNRSQQFGRWINDPNDNSCFNTRAQILARDSKAPVVGKPNNRCVVDKGYWVDPYSQVVLTSAHDVQIDHVVPLKNAYQSGAWKWDFQTRCLYANFTENNIHLLSVNGHENMSKGDSAPDEYMPPNKAYVCEYLRNWLAIKLIWKLTMTHSETAAIDQAIEVNGCRKDQYGLNQDFLNQQRRLIMKNIAVCQSQLKRMQHH